jgi:dTDP-4-amino-4,6-dideoxygalactose transaminase
MRLIPVLRPQLPKADQLLPYLQKIDASRFYTNNGPLTTELEHRLADHFRLLDGGVVCTSSGTAAIIGAVLALAGRATEARPFALLPAFTFVATASAVEQCGYRPYLIDVDAETWMLHPDQLAGHPMLDRAGLVVPVSAFGRMVQQEPWELFVRDTGIPVIVDGAASFDVCTANPDRAIGRIPVAFSFHATKTFATGEGGAVVTTNTAVAKRALQAINFGFYGVRDSQLASINGKMSEYHAAVGLAELDGFLNKHTRFKSTISSYCWLMEKMKLSEKLYSFPDIAACYILCLCHSLDEADAVKRSLKNSKVDFRLWYSEGLHRHSYYVDIMRDKLPITEALAPRLIGLPMAPDLSETDINRVVMAVVDGVMSVRRDFY